MALSNAQDEIVVGLLGLVSSKPVSKRTTGFIPTTSSNCALKLRLIPALRNFSSSNSYSLEAVTP
jgi:hypothetical protein